MPRIFRNDPDPGRPSIFRNDPDPGRPSIFRFEAVSTDILIDEVVSIDAVIDMDTLEEAL